jgi:preprotein translocase subunit YajC
VTTWLRQAVREKVQPEVEEDAVEDDASSIIESAGIEDEKSSAQVAPPLEHGKK